MEDAHLVAVVRGVEKLDEDVLDESIVSDIGVSVNDAAEQVASGAVIHEHENKIALSHNAVYGDDAGMMPHATMKGEFTCLVDSMAGEDGAHHALYCVLSARCDCDCVVNNTE